MLRLSKHSFLNSPPDLQQKEKSKTADDVKMIKISVNDKTKVKRSNTMQSAKKKDETKKNNTKSKSKTTSKSSSKKTNKESK
jgi:hypothetical protein